MKFSFSAKIYKVGINPCVTVPARITGKMTAQKGYIPVKGSIEGFNFLQTLVPVKNEGYRLYVNGPMLKGSAKKTGDTAKFSIEQDFAPPTAATIEMPKELKRQLSVNKLAGQFRQLTPYRQKEILRYLNYLKTEEALQRNVNKVIDQLKQTRKQIQRKSGL